MAYVEPKVEVLALAIEHQVTRTVVRLLEGTVSHSLAPAGLYSVAEPAQERLQLHNLVERKDSCWTFESYDLKTDLLPSTGDVFIFRPWWTQAAMDAALDREATWERRSYPDNGDHDHCLFTWETIAAYAATKEAYWSARHGWITVKAYDDIIQNDLYHLRFHSKDA